VSVGERAKKEKGKGGFKPWDGGHWKGAGQARKKIGNPLKLG